MRRSKTRFLAVGRLTAFRHRLCNLARAFDEKSCHRAQRAMLQGREGGAFSFLHVAAMDSKGNLYAAEVATGRRIQKFSPAAQ
jgi:hypothetical protein